MLTEAQDEYEHQRRNDTTALNDESKRKISELSADFKKVWADPRTPYREKKRIIRLLLEDVTLIRNERITAQIRFRGGATKTLTFDKPKTAWELRTTNPEAVKRIDHLLNNHTEKQIASILNDEGFTTGEGMRFGLRVVSQIRRAYDLKSRFRRLREQGMLTQEELGKELNISTNTVKYWRRGGLLKFQLVNDKGECLYEAPGKDAPIKHKWKNLGTTPKKKIRSHIINEVQYEA